MTPTTALRVGWTLVNGVSAAAFLYLLIDSVRTLVDVWQITPPDARLRDRSVVEALIDGFSLYVTAGFTVLGVLTLTIAPPPRPQPATAASVYSALLLVSIALALLAFGVWRWLGRRAQYARIRRTARRVRDVEG